MPQYTKGFQADLIIAVRMLFCLNNPEMRQSKPTVLWAQHGTQLPCPLRYFSTDRNEQLLKIPLTQHLRSIFLLSLQDQGIKGGGRQIPLRDLTLLQACL